jgi:two-component system, NarL family, invasion response regulator UvrY
MIKVLIVDDHGVVREGLRRILDQSDGIKVSGTAGTGEEAIALVAANDFDVVLMDITMPGKGGMEALKELRRVKPDLPVLVLSMHPEDQYAMRALRAGASGYVMKERTPEELVTAIRKVSGGGTYVSPSFAENLAQQVTGGVADPPHEKLSDREYQVLRMLAAGQSMKGVARELEVCVKTVSTYKRRMQEKLKAGNLAQLVRYAIDNKLV